MAMTPGPWVFEELERTYDGDGYILTEGSRIEVCHHGGGQSLGLPREEILANARAIVEVPAMVEALRVLLGFVDLKYGNLDEDANMAMGITRAILARIKGDG